MIPSPLRRAALVLAIVAFLVVRAAAQTGSDAAFASALEQGAPSFATMAQAKGRRQKPVTPAPKALSAPKDVWEKVLETVKTDGKYRPGNFLMPGSFSIEDSTGDPKTDSTMRRITVLGMINEEDQFEAMGAMIVAVEAKLDPTDGNLHVDNWMFSTDIYGEVGEIAHGTVIKSPDGKIVGTKRETVDPADPKTKAQFDAMLKYWAERTPKGAGK